MPHYNNPHRSAVPPELPSVQQYYPGVNPYGVTDIADTSSVIPYQGGSSLVGAAAPVAEAATKSGFSMPNLGEIKGFIDRMGGIDGIMGTIGKVQKVIGGVQQFAPMAKLLMGSFLPGAKGAAAAAGAAAGAALAAPGELDEYRPRRRRGSSGSSGKRRSSPSRSGRRKGKSSGKGSSSRRSAPRSSSKRRR